MKKILFAGISIILILTTCTKEYGNTDETIALKERVPQSLLNMIKIWHENKIIHNETLVTSNSKSKEKKISLIPDYEHASFETLSNGAILTTVAASDFTLSNSKVGFFRSFVFLAANNKITDGKIVEFYGDSDYIKKNRKYLISNYNSKIIDGFTGSVFTYDMYYRPLRNRGFTNGHITNNMPIIIRSPAYQKQNNSNTLQTSMTTNTTMSSSLCEAQTSRMAQCYDVYWVTDTSSEFLYSYCCEEIGGGNPGSGGSNPPPVTIDSYSGFPSNPIEGQTVTCIDSYGSLIEFTYSASMGLWLMPEIEILRNTGTTLAITGAPTFAPGNILTSIALVAVIEPTFVGEIVLGAATIVYATIYVYEFAKWVAEKKIKDNEAYCQTYLVGCVGSGYECNFCYWRCLNESRWPTEVCPTSSESH